MNRLVFQMDVVLGGDHLKECLLWCAACPMLTVFLITLVSVVA